MKQKGWFKIRAYPHIGLPLTWKDSKRTIAYIKSPEKIAKHSFLPFIHTTIYTPKIRKKYDVDGNVKHSGKRKKQKPKKREIFYANHLDANIYAYYSFLLSKAYEKYLDKRDLSSVVTAYRKIKHEEEKRNKCNVDFANDVFNHIRLKAEQEKTVVIAFDIKGFFDNLNHEKLKQAWCMILDKERLPCDHYKVFRNITKFSYVELEDLFEMFKYNILVKSKSGKIKKKPVKKVKYLSNQDAIAFCEKLDIQTIRSRGLIRNNKYILKNKKKELRNYGICQGSPISAVLANIYMLEFDEFINKEVTRINGLYRRYSDDMVVVCNPEHKEEIIDLFNNQITSLAKLEIQPEKTQVFYFEKSNNQTLCYQEFNGKINQNSYNRNFEYLGFSFDGEYVYLKTSTLAKYHRKMRLAIRRSKYFSKHINNETNGKIFKQRIYKRYSYIGAKPKTKYKYRRKIGTTNKWVKSNKYNWGNFITYANLAVNTFPKHKIKSQIRKHWKILNRELDK